MATAKQHVETVAPARRPLAGVVRSAPAQFFVTRPNLSAALLFAGLVLVYLWPVLIGGDMLSPIALLYQFPPWQGYAPSDVNSYLNPLLSDIPMAVYPWREFARESIHSGTVPLWNERTFTGIPFFSNPQNGLFTPFNLPLWVLPLNYAIGLSAAIKLWFAAFGTYLLCRQLRLGFLPGLLAGVAFSFCAFNITWLTHETLPAVAVMLPWMLLLIERIVTGGRPSAILWLAVVTAIGLGGGHPGTQVHLLAFAGLYLIVRVWLVPGVERGEQLRRLAFAVGGMALGIALMAVMLLPEVLSSNGTIGTRARAGGQGTLPGTVMPFDAIKTTLFPDWWGRPSAVSVAGSEQSAGSIVNFNERTFYAGVVALLFALLALVSRRSWRTKAPFLVLAFVGLAVPLHLPGLWQLVSNVPPFDLVQNQRMHFAFAFGVAILAAFGMRDLLDRPNEERVRLLVPAGGLLLGVVALLAIGVSGDDLSATVRHFTTGAASEVREVVALTSVAWFLLFTLAVLVALLVALRWPRLRYAAAIAVVLLAGADALRFAEGYQPMGPADKLIPPETPAIAYLKDHADDGRIIGAGFTLTQDWSTTYGLSDVRGYDPPNPTEELFDFWRLANPAQADWTPFTVDQVSPESLQVTGVLGARYMVTPPGVQLDPGLRRDPVLGALRIVYEGEDASVLENSRAAPRARVAAAVEVAPDEDMTRALLVRPDHPPARTAIVTADASEAAALAAAPPAHGRVSIVDEGNSDVTLDATLTRRGLVVLNDALMDGWSVTVDGRDAEPVRVNGLMRGVVAGPGRHTIVWSYSMPGLAAGALLSLVALLGLAAAAIWLVLRGRRAQPRTTTAGE